MPSSLVRSYAKKSGKSVKAVEAKWKEAKKAAGKTYDPETNPGAYWGTVNKITRRKLKLGESVMEEVLDEKYTFEIVKITNQYGNEIGRSLYGLESDDLEELIDTYEKSGGGEMSDVPYTRSVSLVYTGFVEVEYWFPTVQDRIYVNISCHEERKVPEADLKQYIEEIKLDVDVNRNYEEEE